MVEIARLLVVFLFFRSTVAFGVTQIIFNSAVLIYVAQTFLRNRGQYIRVILIFYLMMIILESVIFFLVGVLAIRENTLGNSTSLAGLLSYLVVVWILLSFAVSVMMFFVKR